MKETIKQLIRYEKIKTWYEKYERVLMPATLLFGVIVDSITFTSIEVKTSFLILSIYALIAGAIILYLNAYDANRISHERSFFRYLRLAGPLILQFTFGALLSGAFVFYFFSGTIFVSWPFIAILVILMVSNEVFRKYYRRPSVQISIYFFALMSLISIILPFAFNRLGVLIFLASGAVSLLLIAGYVALLFVLAPELKHKQWKYGTSIAVIFAVVQGLYFLNIIPPIPLSVREAVVAHDLDRTAGGYVLQVEKQSWFDKLKPGQTVHKAPGQSVYVYTAIFAPKNLNTTIIHNWQQYDEAKGEWVTRNRLPFQLSGGRKEGFRGYSVKSNVPAGKWRVDVETERGQTLGRISFRVENVTAISRELVRVEK